MKATYLSLILVLMFSIAFCQTKPININSKPNLTNSFSTIDTTKLTDEYSLKKLAKLALQDKFYTDNINLLPKNFSWYADMKRIESIKNMAFNIRQQDFRGRDLPIDVNTQLIQKIYSRSLFDQ